MSRLLPVGRVLYALDIAGFGVLCLIYVDFVAQLQPVNELMPASTLVYSILALLSGVFLVGAGLAIATGIKIHPMTVALVAFFAVCVVLQVPSAFVDPDLLRSPWMVRTFEVLALTGAALIVAGMTSEPERARWMHIGRVLYGVSLPVFGTLHFVYAENTMTIVPSFYPWPLFWVYLTGTGYFAAGLAITTGVLSRPAAILAGAMFGVYALTLHIPRVVTVHIPNQLADITSARPGLTSMFIAIGMCGTAWIIAGSLAERRSSVGEAEAAAQTAEGASEAAAVKATT